MSRPSTTVVVRGALQSGHFKFSTLSKMSMLNCSAVAASSIFDSGIGAVSCARCSTSFNRDGSTLNAFANLCRSVEESHVSKPDSSSSIRLIGKFDNEARSNTVIFLNSRTCKILLAKVGARTKFEGIGLNCFMARYCLC